MKLNDKEWSEKYLIVIGGATATGKTKLAIDLALHFGTEIISADSRQFYREMNIGTAKPTAEELSQVTHHFINSMSITQDYSVGDFEKDALALLEQLYQQRDLAILVGGSGLFLKAVYEGLDEFPAVSPEVQQEVILLYETGGIEALRQALKKVDPVYYKTVDLNNPHRLIRALSVERSSGKPFSSYRTPHKKERPFQVIYILLEVDRSELYERINERVDTMMDNGLLEEARLLFPYKNLNALQTVGYQELFEYLEGKTTMEQAVGLIKQHSRNYAKRQMTWFRKYGQWNCFGRNEAAQVINLVETTIKG